jgi:hypothetical protein
MVALVIALLLATGLSSAYLYNFKTEEFTWTQLLLLTSSCLMLMAFIVTLGFSEVGMNASQSTPLQSPLSLVVRPREEPARTPREEPAIPAVLEVVELLVPRRLRDEDLGDALEVLAALREQGASRWKIQLKVASTAFSILLAALHELAVKPRGIVAPRKEK